MNLKIKDIYLYLAWIIALSGLVISIYFGEFLHIEPCTLCWYQRTALFPLTIILTVAFYLNDTNVNRYAIPLCFLGFSVALFQALSLRIPFLNSLLECASECEKPIFIIFKSFTFPDVSCLGFFLIFILLKRFKNT